MLWGWTAKRLPFVGYDALLNQADSLDPVELNAARKQFRTDQEKAIREKIREVQDSQFSEKHFQQARKGTARILHEDNSPLPLKEQMEQSRRKEQIRNSPSFQELQKSAPASYE